MKELFEKLAELLEVGSPAALTTITASSGSTPRGMGARMLVAEEGRLCGTIGGGVVEHRAEQRAIQAIAEQRSVGRDYILRQNEIEDLGMICGGNVHVDIQYLSPTPEHAAFARRAAAGFDSETGLWLLTDLTDEDGWRMLLLSADAVVAGTDSGGDTYTATPMPEHGTLQPLLGAGAQRGEAGGRQYYSEPLVQAGRAVIFGGGHVSQELVPVLSHLGFRCIVFDDRPQFVTQELFPTAWELILGDFTHIADSITLTGDDYILVLTRGHAGDLAVQQQVLREAHRYVGVIGSRRKIAAVSAKLREAGISQQRIDSVCTPIGLDIGAETPAEIAISIAAQLIAVRAAKGSAPKSLKMV